MAFFSRISDKKEERQPNAQNWLQALFRDFRDVLYIIVIFMVVYVLCFRSVMVVGSSMNKTLVDGDRIILISSVLYREPELGDIVVASKDSFRNGECIVKRVIATEGQKVDIDFENRIVYVDDVPLEEPYAFFAADDHDPMHQLGMSFPLVVDEGCVFVLGDNRNGSNDSRSPEIGLIDCREILGKAVLLIFPGTENGKIPADFSRIGGLY